MKRSFVRSVIATSTFAAAATLVMTGCTASSAPPARSARAAGLQPTSTSTRAVITATQNLAHVVGELQARCMVTAGYPQVARAQHLTEQAPPRYRTVPLSILPIDFGPATLSEAQRYGFSGSVIPMQTDHAAVLVANSRRFDEAADRCGVEIAARYPGLRRLQTDAAAFRDAAEHDFVRRVTPLVTPAVRDRMACLRSHGYPRLDPRRAVHQELAQIVRGAGVEPGRFAAVDALPTQGSLPRGTVRVFPPRQPPGYHPTRAEVAFGRQYVSCARRTHFFLRVRHAARRARHATERLFRTDAAAMSERLTTLSENLRPDSS